MTFITSLPFVLVDDVCMVNFTSKSRWGWPCCRFCWANLCFFSLPFFVSVSTVSLLMLKFQISYPKQLRLIQSIIFQAKTSLWFWVCLSLFFSGWRNKKHPRNNSFWSGLINHWFPLRPYVREGLLAIKTLRKNIPPTSTIGSCWSVERGGQFPLVTTTFTTRCLL